VLDKLLVHAVRRVVAAVFIEYLEGRWQCDISRYAVIATTASLDAHCTEFTATLLE